MRAFVRAGWFAATATLLGVLSTALSAQGQAQPQPKGTATAPGAGATAKEAAPTMVSSRVVAAKLAEVLATVNGEKITRGDLLDFLNRYQIPPDNEELIYRDAVDTLVNMKLVGQFLAKQNIKVSEDRINEAVSNLESQLKADGSSLAQALVESNKSINQVREEYANRIRWIDFVKARGTDAELKKFADAHKELLSGTQIKASHILRKVDPKAAPADKEKVRQALANLKRMIEAKQMTFADAANKYSEDEANAEKGGGDIGYFDMNSGIVEEFAKAAFGLKVNQISDPVETSYGYHLILVTDRQEKPPIDFEQNKPMILNAYSMELQKDLLVAQRKSAKIEVQPMPKDLFEKVTTPVPTGAPGTAPGTAPAPAPAPGAAPKGAAAPGTAK